MPGIQIGFLIFTFVGPLLLWILSRHLESERFARGICWLLALALVAAKISTVLAVWREGNLTADYALPMHLCDWALVATVGALLLRQQICFELAYFWGIAGTAQALITPALDSTEFLRVFAFFVVHSVIPASVLWLIFDSKMRPQRRAWLRVALWSQVYLVCALVVNALSGGNYGFLSGRPDGVRSMLDIFSDPVGWKRWLYVLEIDLTALLFFLVLDLPWQFARWRTSRGEKNG
jgi:hypothetical integral membrane protein (TIGR02206 family)